MPINRANPMRNLSSKNLNRQMSQYALAAAVAGVSLLALSEPAASEVVVTRKTIPIPISTEGGLRNPVKISLSNNGINNFSFFLSSAPVRQPGVLTANSAGTNGSDNQILAGGNFYGLALPLPRGTKISSHPASGVFSFMPLIEATDTSGGSFYTRGYWGGNLKDRYLGVRFKTGGQYHYGWIRLTVTTDVKQEKPTLTATITGYAYETVPNKPILAGTAGTASAETHAPEQSQNRDGASLGILALGSEGLPLWRRNEALVRGENKLEDGMKM